MAKGRKGHIQFMNLCAISLPRKAQHLKPENKFCIAELGNICQLDFFGDQKSRFVLPKRLNELISF